MGLTTAVKHLLKSLCYNSKWKYAVFWKLNQAQLTWEDGYVDNEKSGGFLSGKSGIIAFGCEVDNQSGNPVNCPIELAVASMSCNSYRLGEGIVGKVASTIKHHWMFAAEANSISQEEYHEEWKQQFEAGIKTVLLVPVVSHGVVQLGSSDKVLENLREVVRIRDHFSAFQNATGACISLLPMTSQPEYYTPFTSPFTSQGVSTSIFTDETTFSDLFTDQIEETHVDSSMFTNNITVAGMSTSFLFEGELGGVSSMSHGLTSGYMKDLEHEAHNQGFMDYSEEMNSVLDCPFSTFLSSSALQESFDRNTHGFDDCTWHDLIPKTDELNSSAALSQPEPPEMYSSTYDTDAWFTREQGTEQLLESVIAELLMTSDDKQSDKSRCTGLCSSSSCACSGSLLTQCKNEDVTCKRSVLDCEDSVSSPMRSSGKSTISMSPNSEQLTSACEPHERAPSTNNSRKRSHASTVHKPKPRDRQLIQDRIKELRELIPNGSKCSIDALLYQTIKHMMFLQSVPCHAEKLKHSAHFKVKVEDHGSSGAHMFNKGASWVYELGRQQQKHCPLIVENLDQPGQMLIEMQCDDYGFFLEIAQVIRRLKLIILKGILETRSDKLWAHFIIESPKRFHRMDILWPLVQLLQRKDVSLF